MDTKVAGSKGGKRTLKKYGKDYYKRLSIIGNYVRWGKANKKFDIHKGL